MHFLLGVNACTADAGVRGAASTPYPVLLVTLTGMTVLLGYDPETLRERVDLLEVGHRLDELGEMRSRDALCERAWLLKVAGRTDEALDLANTALRLARFTGERSDVMHPRILRATVLQAAERYDEALTELTACADEARTQDWAVHEATALLNRGKVLFDLGRDAEALSALKAALRIVEDGDAPDDRTESIQFAIAVVQERIAAQQ